MPHWPPSDAHARREPEISQNMTGAASGNRPTGPLVSAPATTNRPEQTPQASDAAGRAGDPSLDGCRHRRRRQQRQAHFEQVADNRPRDDRNHDPEQNRQPFEARRGRSAGIRCDPAPRRHPRPDLSPSPRSTGARSTRSTTRCRSPPPVNTRARRTDDRPGRETTRTAARNRTADARETADRWSRCTTATRSCPALRPGSAQSTRTSRRPRTCRAARGEAAIAAARAATVNIRNDFIRTFVSPPERCARRSSPEPQLLKLRPS